MRVQWGVEIEARGATRPLVKQVHGAAVEEVPTLSRWEALRASPPEADGVWSRAKGIELYVFTADCLPVLLFDDENIAAVHCGWRGAKAGIVNVARSRFQRAGKLHAVLGPAILSCCFEVKDDFVQAFRTADHLPEAYLEQRGGKQYFDLVSFVVETQLEQAEIDRSALRCTVCSTPQLPSYRRNHDTDPRLRTWIKRTFSL